ncbi:MAG: glucokinase [Gammaproteobacteria bacterium]|nr:glucokinase [Gammaproteobacteria bacterium]
MKVLAGDIGGTKTLLLIAECRGRDCSALFERRYASAAYPGLTPMVQAFLGAAGKSGRGLGDACFAVAGPVTTSEQGQYAKTTNLPWEIDQRALSAALDIPRLRLINDFQAVGYGIEALEPRDLEVLQRGLPQPGGPRAVLGAGTGLGTGLLLWQDDHYEALPSEGGHADFAPCDEQQIELLRYLRREHEHVSWERVLSGPGLVNLYAFLRDTGGARESPALRRAMQRGDAAAAISRHALAGRDPLAGQALDLFVRLYGAQAGNVALGFLATGGVYLAGGIAAKIIERLRAGALVRAFNDKGRMAPLLSSMPVRVILNPRVGLLGAALAASRL